MVWRGRQSNLRGRPIMQLDTLSKDDRAKIAVHLRRFTAALEHQRRFDREVAASVGR